jgi:hypothetical protein
VANPLWRISPFSIVCSSVPLMPWSPSA